MKTTLCSTLYLALIGASVLLAQPASFTRITNGLIAADALRSWGCSLVDYDNDGLVDVFVATAYGGTNALYHNDGNFAFGKVTTEPVVTTYGDFNAGVFADYDNDGDLDLFATGFAPYKSCFFRNDLGVGNATLFTQVATGAWVTAAAASVGAAWGDYDNDGFVDLVVANASAAGQNEFLYRNDGTGGMGVVNAPPLTSIGGRSYGCSWCDYDGDGDLDLFVANWNQAGFLFRNEGGGAFFRVTEGEVATTPGSWLGTAWGDYDNDGDSDLFVSNTYDQNNVLYRNDGGGTFVPIGDDPVVTSGGMSTGAAWGDFDNDGYLDLFVANAAGQAAFLFHNERDGTFTRIYDGDVVDHTGNGVGAAWADLDNDGFLDLFVANSLGESAGTPNFLYRNDAKANGNSNGWLLVRLVGTVSNRAAIGAAVRVKATLSSKEVRQLRQVSGGSGYVSQNDLRAHFGLGDATTVNTLRIEWPSGIVQELKDITPNQILTVTEPVRLIPQGAGAFQIQCWINQAFDVEASTDLTAWSNVATVTNLTGTLVFEDANAAQHESRYYRVVVP